MQVEDPMQLSRPEALAMMRQIDEMIEDAEDVAIVEHLKECGCNTTFEESSGCVFKDIDARKPNGLDSFIDAPLLNE